MIDDIYDFAEAQGFEIDTIIQEGGAGAGRDQLPARRPAEARRPGLLLQAHDPRGGVAQQLLRDLHGQADAGGAGIGDAHPSVGGRRQDRAGTSSPTRRARRRTAFYSFLAGQQRHIPTRGLHAGALRQQLPALRAARLGADQPRVGAGQPDHGAAGADRRAARAADREPGRGDGLQPVSRARGVAGLRVPRDEGGAEAARRGGGGGLSPAAGAAARPAGGARPVRASARR